jgi:hypothetical protein
MEMQNLKKPPAQRSALAANSRALGKLQWLLPAKGRRAGECLLQMDPGDFPQVIWHCFFSAKCDE